MVASSMAQQTFGRRLQAMLVLLLIAVSSGSARTATVTFEKIFPLKANEGVFAYARISPNGHYLAYAFRNARGVLQTETVVDLKDQSVVFTEPGNDGYSRMTTNGDLPQFCPSGQGGVTIWHQRTGALSRNVAPPMLGDYFSWSVRNGKNVILTIRATSMNSTAIRPCSLPAVLRPALRSAGAIAPLISKDGRRITTFVRKGHVVVRGLTDCNDILDTGLQGAKADFSFDGRYVAFHVARNGGRGSRS